MASSWASEVLRSLRTALSQQEATRTDAQLLEDFRVGQDAAALAALVHRYGPMVWGVCRRLLGSQDAEDAFQVTFLVLVRKAASINAPQLLPNWLYRVARQTALKTRAGKARRSRHEKQVALLPESPVNDPIPVHDLRLLLERELSRLPDKYRVALLLCGLEGATRKEAAQRLGVPEGTLASWLARGRALLARRLARHGLPACGSAALGLSCAAAEAGVPAPLTSRTIWEATRYATGHTVPSSFLSARVAGLVKEMLQSMMVARLGSMTSRVLAALAVAAAVGFGVAAVRAPGRSEQPAWEAHAAGPPDQRPLEAPSRQAQPKALPGAGRRPAVHTQEGAWRRPVEIQAGTSLYGVSFAPDGQRAALAGFDRGLGLLRAGAGDITWLGKPATAGAVAFSPDGQQLALCVCERSADEVRLLDARTAQENRRAALPQGAHLGHGHMLFAADGRSLLVAASDLSQPGPRWCVFRWKLSEISLTRLRVFDGSEPIPFPRCSAAAALSPDGKRLATTRGDGHVRIWEVDSGKAVGIIAAHDKAARAVAWSADGKLLATGGLDGWVRVWDASAGVLKAEQRALAAQVTCVCFGPDASLLAAGSSPQGEEGGWAGVALWDWTSGRALGTRRVGRSHDDVRAVTLSADAVAAISCHDVLAVWPVPRAGPKAAREE